MGYGYCIFYLTFWLKLFFYLAMIRKLCSRHLMEWEYSKDEIRNYLFIFPGRSHPDLAVAMAAQ